MRVGDILKVKIVDDNHLGNGIAKYDEKIIFIPKTVIGDVVKILITKINKNYAFAEVINILEKNSNHLNVSCPYYDKCGGCDLLHVSYDREKQLKEDYIKKLFNGFNCRIISYDRYYYRNKVTLHVENNSIGFFENNSKKLVPVKKCMLLNNKINDVISLFNQFDLSNVKEVVIKNANEGLLVSIEGKLNIKDLDKLKNANVKSIYQNNKLVYGKEYLTISLGSIIYNINNNSFFQINNDCAEALYNKIKEVARNCDNLLDLYCGTGSIGIYLNQNAKSVTGIEINKDSVKCAKKNIDDNSINNYKIINADASCIDKDYDVVIVDPPRSGLSKDVIDILNKMKSKKLIYISCNPNTLKRDINLLNSYSLNEISVFNMFPATKHIETVCYLTCKVL